MAGFMEPAKLAIFFLIISSVLAIGLNMEDETSFPFLLPKVELHAHLHGSIRQSTLIEFARSANDSGSSSFLLEGERDLNKCFGIFQAIHSMIRSKETVLKVLLEVLEDFMSENVIYLELRSTPRNLEDGTTKLEYIDLLVSTIEMHNELYGDRMLVRLLISIDRSKSLEENEETVELALGVRTRSKVIVGIDLSGNPLKGNFVSFLPILKKCSESGMFITIHTAEIPDKESVRNEIKDIADESVNDFSGSTFESEREEILSPLLTETDQILFFGPDRLGHALHLQPRHIDLLLAADESYYGLDYAINKIGSAPEASQRAPIIEICPTSNSYTLQLSNLQEHPTLGKWIDTGYPIAISTDDSGVFATSLSKEFSLVQQAFNLSTLQMIAIAAAPIDYIFAPELIPEVRTMFQRHIRNMNLESESESESQLFDVDVKVELHC